MPRSTRRVTIGLSEVVNSDVEGLLDLFDEKGWPDAGPIQDIDYKAVGIESGGYAITFDVTADAVYECSSCGYELSEAPLRGQCASCEGR